MHLLLKNCKIALPNFLLIILHTSTCKFLTATLQLKHSLTTKITYFRFGFPVCLFLFKIRNWFTKTGKYEIVTIEVLDINPQSISLKYYGFSLLDTYVMSLDFFLPKYADCIYKLESASGGAMQCRTPY